MLAFLPISDSHTSIKDENLYLTFDESVFVIPK